MLEIPFDKLPGSGAQDMFARNGRARVSSAIESCN